MLKKFWKGFSWIEIASVVLLFSVVLLLTLPSYPKFQCMAKQSEAKFELLRILSAAKLFKEKYNRYPNMGELLDSERIKLRQKHYSYEISSSKEDSSLHVVASGRPKSQVESDLWRVDERKNLENLKDACAQIN